MSDLRERQLLAEALCEALHDEYQARAAYQQIIRAFGPVRPFTNILAAEERHVQALLVLFRRYEIPIPEDDWKGRVTLPASLREACEQGVAAEIGNAAMYDRLLAAAANYPDVCNVFLNLQEASQYNHLPAFQRGLDREGRSQGGDRLAAGSPGCGGGGRARRRRRGRCAV